MQRSDPEGIVISCDFCLRDWDGQEPMVEGHHGSVLCIPCLEKALSDKHPAPPTADPATTKFQCTLCLQERDTPTILRWTHPTSGSPATVCESCIKLAARTFSKSPLTDWSYDPKS